MNRCSDYFSNYIDNDILSIIGNGEIKSFTISRERRMLTIGLYLDRFLSFSDISRAEKAIEKAMDLHKTVINPVFPKADFSLSDIERILEYVKRDTPAANGFFDGAEAELEDNTLTIFLKRGGKEVLESQHVDSAVASLLSRLFNVDYDISFLEVQAFDI
ncbi:MAG: hypothetical protein K2F67_05730, partial [Eubacterium sp.]|nr:hypothetical protein [Eubacterium sp.]